MVGRWAAGQDLARFFPPPRTLARLNWFPTRKDGPGTITGNFPLLPKYQIPSIQVPNTKYQIRMDKYETPDTKYSK